MKLAAIQLQMDNEVTSIPLEKDNNLSMKCSDPVKSSIFTTPTGCNVKEKFRDFSIWILTLHRIFLLSFLSGGTIGIYFLQRLIWSGDVNEKVTWWSWLGLIWLLPLPSTVAWIVGALHFRHNTNLDEVKPSEFKVSFRIVSRGTNSDCLLSTIRRCQMELKKCSIFPYVIEVVTDGDSFLAPDDDDIIQIRVPEWYRPPNGSLYKARALHYACLTSKVGNECWVVHLDEESHLTSSAIKGIADMIQKCERRKDIRRIGQGMILYHRGWKCHPLLTLADMRRTGDDVGHFFLQHKLGITIFGLHGSFVVARQDIEKELGFDVGPNGSITEDAWWVLLAMKEGIRTIWVDGYIEEQSTQSVFDFVKQRRRWYVGLLKVGIFCPVKVRYRIFLLWNIASWIVVPIVLPLQISYMTLSIVFEKRVLIFIRLSSSLILVTALSVYIYGLVLNMREHGTPWYRAVIWTVLQIILMPVFLLMESLGILLALLYPISNNAKGFHVVQK